MTNASRQNDLSKTAKKLLDRRQRVTNQWQGIIQQYVDKSQEERTSYAYDQLGVSVYELHASRFLLKELQRLEHQFAHDAPTKPCNRPVHPPQLPL